MLNIGGFLKYFIGFTFSIILIVNILFAFNIANDIIAPIGSSGAPSLDIDTSNGYFGVSTLIDTFKKYFTTNDAIGNMQYVLGQVSSKMTDVSLSHIVTNVDVPSAWATIFSVLLTIVDTLLNIAWIFVATAYVVILLVYAVVVIFTFFNFLLACMSGMSLTPLPSTQFPEITPIPLDVQYLANSCRLMFYNLVNI